MLGMARKNKKRNEWIREKTGVDDIMAKIDVMKWSWDGDLGRMENDRWAKKVQNAHLEQNEVEGDQQEDGVMILRRQQV